MLKLIFDYLCSLALVAPPGFSRSDQISVWTEPEKRQTTCDMHWYNVQTHVLRILEAILSQNVEVCALVTVKDLPKNKHVTHLEAPVQKHK